MNRKNNIEGFKGKPKRDYIIKPFYGTQENDKMIELDRVEREKIEAKTGQMTDAAWFQYKLLRIKRKR